jgi:hypothetical protein
VEQVAPAEPFPVEGLDLPPVRVSVLAVVVVVQCHRDVERAIVGAFEVDHRHVRLPEVEIDPSG